MFKQTNDLYDEVKEIALKFEADHAQMQRNCEILKKSIEEHKLKKIELQNIVKCCDKQFESQDRFFSEMCLTLYLICSPGGIEYSCTIL